MKKEGLNISSDTKLIFLDIDGVLNHQLWYTSSLFKEGKTHVEYELSQFCPETVCLLNNLTDETGAVIVISASLRAGKSLEELQDLFERVGITGKVIGKTPHLRFRSHEDEYTDSVPRGCEIKAWLDMNAGHDAKNDYIIFDDDSDMLYWQRNNFIWVDSHCGLTPNLIYKAKRMFGLKTNRV